MVRQTSAGSLRESISLGATLDPIAKLISDTRLIDTENAKVTDPEVIEKNLALGEHVKKGS